MRHNGGYFNLATGAWEPREGPEYPDDKCQECCRCKELFAPESLDEDGVEPSPEVVALGRVAGPVRDVVDALLLDTDEPGGDGELWVCRECISRIRAKWVDTAE